MHISTAYNIRYVCFMDFELWFEIFLRFKDNMLIKLNNLLSHVIIIRFVLKKNYIFKQVIIFSSDYIDYSDSNKYLQLKE